MIVQKFRGSRFRVPDRHYFKKIEMADGTIILATPVSESTINISLKDKLALLKARRVIFFKK